MCDIWRQPFCEELKPATYTKLPSSLKFINISGGEPFLRKDLTEIVQNILNSCPKAEISISSNGVLTESITQQTKKILEFYPNIRIMISIDGIGEVHDTVRGIKGTFDSAIHSVTLLKQLGVKKLGLASTATNYNISESVKVMQLAREMKLDYTFNGVPNRSELTFKTEKYRHFKPGQLNSEVNKIVCSLLRSSRPRNWVRAYVNSGIYPYIITDKRKIPCFAATDFFFMTPNGEVFPCMVLNHSLGNLKNQTFEDIWYSKNAKSFRRKIVDINACPSPCWMLCTVFPHMRRNKITCIKWMATNKIRAHLGLHVKSSQGPIPCVN